uniref:hypothetical protein n=1 Tax=Pantanalinema rosaneae TaxID=1620701 RepID=UPI003D6EC581
MRPIASAFAATLRDMLPIIVTIGLFQALVLGRWPEDALMLAGGSVAALIGLTLSFAGWSRACFRSARRSRTQWRDAVIRSG